MKHLGDITNIDGAEIESVDCITFGSPCQDLSVAGKRAGLAGERSGLFMEACRIIREMRGATNGIYPTFAVWENVPGAFSSNGGEDFRAVLEELARCAEQTASIPRPDKGKWNKAGVIVGDEWSIAWRTLDAQFWGVPQRRRRIAVVLGLGTQCAAEILFEREGVSRHLEPSIPPWKGSARNPANRTDGHDCLVGDSPYTLKIRSGCEGGGKGPLVQTDKSATLAVTQDQTLFQPVGYGICSYASNSMKSSNPHSGIYQADTTRTLDLNGGNPACNQGGTTLESRDYKDPDVVCYGIGNGQSDSASHPTKEVVGTLNCMHDPMAVMYRLILWIVRRLTPLECERLQGFPDGWTDIGEWVDSKGKKHKDADAPRYKALGNSIALPQWWWLVNKMAIHLPEQATLGSLFDGIGGFPLVWEELHGKGTARWASEIEEFPIAVTKLRFPEE